MEKCQPGATCLAVARQERVPFSAIVCTCNAAPLAALKALADRMAADHAATERRIADIKARADAPDQPRSLRVIA